MNNAIAALAIAVGALVGAGGCGTAHADPPPPPDPVQCKVVNGTNVCRYPDGSVQACNPLVGCHPIYMQPAPGF
jgi:hypothetical protein